MKFRITKRKLFIRSSTISEDAKENNNKKKKSKSKNPPLSRIVEKMLKEKREKDRFLLEK